MRDFEKERNQAQREAEQITTYLEAHGYEVGEIDYARAGRLAYVPINGIEVSDVLTLSGSGERGQLLDHVRYRLLEAAAQQQLHSTEHAVSWIPLDRPENAPLELQSLWRIHLGEDDMQPGVNIAEIVRENRRVYEYYPDGAQLGVHAFNVDVISVQAIQVIKRNGGTIVYDPEAQRADRVVGRRLVTFPEGTEQSSEGEQFMAPQRFRLPDGTQLRLTPDWHTVALDIVDGGMS